MSVFSGLGFGLIYLPAIVAVNYYFESRRALATGIAVCGSGFGTFVFAPFASFLIREYGWKGGNMILAGIIFNAIVSVSATVRLSGNRAAPRLHDPEGNVEVVSTHI